MNFMIRLSNVIQNKSLFLVSFELGVFFHHNPGNDQRVSSQVHDKMDNRIPLVDKSSGIASPTQQVICQIWIEAFFGYRGSQIRPISLL